MYKTKVKIEGMMCPMCESHVNDTIRKSFPEAKKVKSSHTKNETIIISEKEYTKEQLSEILDPTGYKVISAESAPYDNKLISLFR